MGASRKDCQLPFISLLSFCLPFPITYIVGCTVLTQSFPEIAKVSIPNSLIILRGVPCLPGDDHRLPSSFGRCHPHTRGPRLLPHSSGPGLAINLS